MVLEDLKDKIDILNTMLPTMYWIIIVANYGVSIFTWIYLFIGIILTVLQMLYQRIYKHTIKFDKKSQTVKSPHVISKWVLIFSIITLFYGFFTFVCMLVNPKELLIWMLIVLYTIGMLYVIIFGIYINVKNPNVVEELKTLFK